MTLVRHNFLIVLFLNDESHPGNIVSVGYHSRMIDTFYTHREVAFVRQTASYSYQQSFGRAVGDGGAAGSASSEVEGFGTPMAGMDAGIVCLEMDNVELLDSTAECTVVCCYAPLYWTLARGSMDNFGLNQGDGAQFD